VAELIPNNEYLIEVEGVSKKFSRSLKKSLLYGLKDIIVSFFGYKQNRSELRIDEFWAVKNASFKLRRGECLGLIGHNGAGKSTLLKMLNGLIRPDEGKITMRGKVGALIELGAGFDPILSGRENVYINGQILGFSKNEIDDKYDAIVEFSELSEFMEMPVQNYSSGMKVRLGFAVAAQMEPDILLIDEVLAVGDLGFVLKCLSTIDNLLENTVFIFVSHNIPQVSRLCTELLILDKGKPIYHGNDVSKGFDLYYNKYQIAITNFRKSDFAELLELKISSAQELDGIPLINRLDDFKVEIDFKLTSDILEPFAGITIYDKEQRPVGIASMLESIDGSKIIKTSDGYNYYKIGVTIPRINLSKGIYTITFFLSESLNAKPLLRLQVVEQFQVTSAHDVWPPIEFEALWDN